MYSKTILVLVIALRVKIVSNYEMIGIFCLLFKNLITTISLCKDLEYIDLFDNLL